VKEMEKKINSKKFEKNTKKRCKKAFCNPKCKGTIFQNVEFPKEIEKEYQKEKDCKQIIPMFKIARESLFRGKKTILKDSFYENLKDTNKIKKKGAISGCVLKSIL
jgi:hypothetical protein